MSRCEFCPGNPEVGSWTHHMATVHPGKVQLGRPPVKNKPQKAKAGFQSDGTIEAIGKMRPGSTKWRVGGRDILVDENDLFEALILYDDIKAKTGAQSPFSKALVNAMRIAWQLTVARPEVVIRQETKVEVDNNGGQRTAGNSKAELGREQVLIA